ncbi:hypothetical protein [Streptomyces sp. NPDC059761]|uniref:hypothetical protein n=1 Tax=Streptomyces sp. NPDC059761 TaxID=3346937 RepID=UPI0036619CC8
MSGTTPRLGLKTWDQSDPFLRQDFNDNNSRLDAYPAPYLCTESSRPAWGSNQSGMRIFERDTRRELVWTGTSWRELLQTPPVWTGAVFPNAAMGLDTHIYYKIGQVQVNRPASMLVWLNVEVQCQSIYTMNAHFRPQVDGGDCSVGGGSASFIRVEQVHSSGGGWSRNYMVPAMGIRDVGVGSHSFGLHMFTTPSFTTSSGSMSMVGVRGVAMLVNDRDT